MLTGLRTVSLQSNAYRALDSSVVTMSLVMMEKDRPLEQLEKYGVEERRARCGSEQNGVMIDSRSSRCDGCAICLLKSAVMQDKTNARVYVVVDGDDRIKDSPSISAMESKLACVHYHVLRPRCPGMATADRVVRRFFW